MKDELFDDLISSAKEMVEIEQGLKQPTPEQVHQFERPKETPLPAKLPISKLTVLKQSS